MTTNNLIIIELIAELLFLLKKEQPNLLKEKYRNQPWQEVDFQNKFKSKLSSKLDSLIEEEELINKSIDLLYFIVSSSFFTSDYFVDFLNKVKSSKVAINNQNQGLNFSFTILLLDTENIYIDINSEKELARVCNYPIKLKFAFGNWRNLGKKDVEFYQRGYELFHVPSGKNSADLKMISFGSSIWLNYPNAKEVLICSSDGDLNHLSTTLQHHGITVYKVSRRGNELIVINHQTNEIKNFLMAKVPDFLDLQDCLREVKVIIESEQKRTDKSWIKLSRVQNLFEEKFKLTLEDVMNYHFPSQNLEDTLLRNNQGIAMYKMMEDNQSVYLTIFDNQKKEKQTIKLDSPANLERALRQIIQQLSKKSQSKYITMSQVASEFQNKYKVSITKVTQDLQLGKKFIKLIQSYDYLEVKKENNIYYIAIIQTPP